MTTVFAQPDYTVDYDPSILNTFHTIAASKVNAYIDEVGGVHDLTLGASSNVNLEAFDGINIYFDKDHALTVFNTVMQSNVRTDTPILKVSQDPAHHITYLQSSNAPLYLSGLDSNVSTKVSQTLFTASNNEQVLQTDLDAFDFRAPLYLSSNLDVSKDVVSHNNIACAGNMFSSSLNVYKNYTGSNVGSNSQVAFGFFINEYEHLELVKYHKYTVSNVVQSEMKRVATFGKMPGNGVGNLSNYSALNEFNGIIGQSNGNTPQMTNMLWGSQSGTSNVYYTVGNVGVGTAVPSEKLHVKGGNLKVQGNILPDSNLTYDLGSSNLRWRDLYLSGNTINLAGALITVTPQGTIALQDQNGTPAVDFSDLTSNANLALSVATDASNMAYSLASAAINSNSINFSSNTSAASSNNSFALSNYVYGANKTTLLWASNNMVKTTGGNVTGTLSATQIGIGQVSPTEKLEVVGNIKSTSNVYVATKLGVGTVTPQQPLHVVGNSRLEGNVAVTGVVSQDLKVAAKFTASNSGTGPALNVYQMGVQPIADFFDNDTLVVRIDNGGKIGINTGTPQYTLDIVGDINFTGSLMQNGSVFSSGGGGGASVFSYNSSNVYLMTSNVGIGKSNPSYALDVVGTVSAGTFVGSTITSLSNLGLAASNVAYWSSNNLLTKTGGTINGSLVVTSNIQATSNMYAMVKLGVATNTPSYTLDVNGSARVGADLYLNSNQGANYTSNLTHSTVTTADTYIYSTGGAGGSNIYTKALTVSAGSLTGAYWGGSPSMYGAALNLRAGNVNLIGNNGSAPSFGYGGDLNFYPGYAIVGTASVGPNWRVYGGRTIFYRTNSNSLAVDSNYSIAAIIDNLGNFGIGLSNPAYTLDVAGTANATSFSGPTITALSNLGMAASNAAIWSSNTAISASNTTISLSNYVYGSNATQVSFSSNTSVSASNTAIWSSNTALWSSNNLLTKTGGTITGSLDVTSNVKATSNIYAMSRIGVGTSNPSVPLHIIGDARIEGNLNVNGIYNTINTDVQVTDQFTVSNNGTGPALNVYQMGAQNIASFYDDSNIAMAIVDGGSVSIGKSNPSEKFDVVGNIKASSNVYAINRLGVATSNPTSSLHVVGDSRFDGIVYLNNSNVTLSNALVGIGIAAPTEKVDIVGGNLKAASNVYVMNRIGVGLSNPSFAVDVAGKMRLTGNVTSQTGAPRVNVSDFDGTEDLATYGLLQVTKNANGTSTYSNQASIACIRGGVYATALGYAKGSNVFGFGLGQTQNTDFTPNWLSMTIAGNIGIGTTSPTYPLHVAGTIYATGDVTAYSDARAKSNLEVISSALDKVSQLTGYTYDFIDASNVSIDKKTKITERFTGVIAQDLEKVLPEAVHSDEEGKLSVAYGNMAGLFVESIKELKSKNAALEAKVAELEGKLCTCDDASSTSTSRSVDPLSAIPIHNALTTLKELVSVDNSVETINLVVQAIKELDEKVESLKPKRRVAKK